eukprot:15473891-Alexandrium_andersonii.AAC.1
MEKQVHLLRDAEDQWWGEDFASFDTKCDSTLFFGGVDEYRKAAEALATDAPLKAFLPNLEQQQGLSNYALSSLAAL